MKVELLVFLSLICVNLEVFYHRIIYTFNTEGELKMGISCGIIISQSDKSNEEESFPSADWVFNIFYKNMKKRSLVSLAIIILCKMSPACLPNPSSGVDKTHRDKFKHTYLQR